MGIKLFVMDVDGTLTDGKIYMSPAGEAMKAFNIKDGCGIHDILIPAGIVPVVITGRKSDIVSNRCKEIGIESIYQGVNDKLKQLKQLTEEFSVVAYIGDDINDLLCMKAVKKNGGIVGCPNDAVQAVKSLADYIAPHNGGDGAVRDFIEWIMSRHNYCDRRKMENIKITVIIPIFNMEKYLEECLDNVLAQTLRNIEIICVDDGSTDESCKVLMAYQKEHSNIRIISQSNKGAGPARNAAMDIARGKYIAFMDADDRYVDCNTLEMLYSYAEKEAAVICGGSLVSEKEGVRYESSGYYRKSSFQSTGIVDYREYQYAYGYQRFLFLASFLKEHKIQFPPYRRFQDPPFMAEAMMHAKTFYAVAENVYVHRLVDKSFLYERFDILNDVARGIDDVLLMSAEEHLEKLHSDMVEKMLSYMCDFYKSIYRGNCELEELWEKLLQHVDDSLLREDGHLAQRPVFKAGKEIKQYINGIYEKERKFWKKIERFSEVVIYGAGMTGKKLYEYMVQKGYKGMVGFSATCPKPDEILYGKKVNSIKEYLEKRQKVLVLVAAIEENASVMMEYADEIGFTNIEKIAIDDIELFQKWKIDLLKQ